MPRYDWNCSCGATTEVFRTYDESGVGPYGKCRNCGGTFRDGPAEWKRVFGKFTLLVPGGTSERNPFPIKVDKIDKVMLVDGNNKPILDPKGLPVFEYRDVIFTSAAQQKEWLDQRGQGLFMEGEADSTKGNSEHSFFDQPIPAAPSAAAEQILSNAHFVEDLTSFTDSIKGGEIRPPDITPLGA